MGSDRFYPEEAPVHRVERRRLLDGRAPGDGRRVPSLREGHRPRHRRREDAERRPTTPTPTLTCWCPGRSCSRPRADPSPSTTGRDWWAWMPGAAWRHPEGPGSNLGGRDRHPVVHVAYADAVAYADGRARSCRRRPSGSARRAAGSTARRSPGATTPLRRASTMANTWQGEFPWQNLALDGYARHVAGEALPAERLRPLRRGRQRLGVDRGLVHAAATPVTPTSPVVCRATRG